MLNTWTASPNEIATGTSSAAGRRIALRARGLDEEVQQDRRPPGATTSM